MIGKGGFGKVCQSPTFLIINRCGRSREKSLIHITRSKKFQKSKSYNEIRSIQFSTKECYCLSSNIRNNTENNGYRFLINMFYAFQDLENLYLVTDLVQGCDLRYHLKERKG